MGKLPGSLKSCVLSPLPFCSAHSPVDSWTRSRLHNLLSGITDTNNNWQPKNISSIARLSHEWKVRTFLLTIGISLHWKRLLGIFLGWGWGVKNPSLLHLHGVTLEKSLTRVWRQSISEIFIYHFCTNLGWSVGGVHRGSPWTTYGPVHGLPLLTTPQNIIELINKYFSYGLSNRLLVTAKFW